MGVRFILVPVAPGGAAGGPVTPPALLDSLDRQLDLRRVELGDDSLVAYENMAWLPVRATASGATAAAGSCAGPEALIRSDFSEAEPALPASSRRPAPVRSRASPCCWPSPSTHGGADRRRHGRCPAAPRSAGPRRGTSPPRPGARSATRPAASRYAIVLVQILLGVLALLLIRTWRHGPPLRALPGSAACAASPATTVIDLTAEPPDRAPQAVLERNGRAP